MNLKLPLKRLFQETMWRFTLCWLYTESTETKQLCRWLHTETVRQNNSAGRRYNQNKTNSVGCRDVLAACMLTQ